MNPFPPGKTWGRDWIAPFEGAFTIAQKFAWANAPSMAELQQLFGAPANPLHKVTNANSFLMYSDEARVPLPRRHFLSHWAGDWTRLLASDEHFKYCPECVRYGYQSFICQLAEFTCCPAHHCPLLSVCMQCCRPTCEYALVSRSFKKPMHCHHCGTPWGGTLRVTKWNDKGWWRWAYWEIWGRWLEVLSKSPLKPGMSLSELLISEPESRYRGVFANNFKRRVSKGDVNRVAFAAAKAISLHDVCEPEGLLAPPHYWRFMTADRRWPFDDSEELQVDREQEKLAIKQIYKSIRRQMQRRYLRDRRDAVRRGPSNPFSPPPNVGADPVVEAFTWWRAHLENYVGKPSKQQTALLRTVSGDPSLTFSTFFRQSFAVYLDTGPRKDPNLIAVLFAASFYRACWKVLIRCRESNRPPVQKPWSPEFDGMFVTHWQEQLASPCWLAPLDCMLLGTPLEKQQQYGTLTASAHVVHELRNWRW